MYKDATIAVVVPAHNEETQIARVIETMPDFVDRIIIVDDASTDQTCAVVEKYLENAAPAVQLIKLEKNEGVGGAIEAGYREALAMEATATAVMAGDGQMDPNELSALLDPVIAGEVEYTKGNRLILGDSWKQIPKKRFIGSAILSILTKIASGYWHIADSQNGYTAISLTALDELLKDKIYHTYGMPNDVLVKLNVHNFGVRDIPMRPVYNIGEQSKMKIPKVIFPISWLLIRLFFYRLWNKYIVRDTHPLVLFYGLGMFLAPLGILYGLLIVGTRLFWPLLFVGPAPELLQMISTQNGVLLDTLVTLTGFQMLLFAMWFDMQYNANLR